MRLGRWTAPVVAGIAALAGMVLSVLTNIDVAVMPLGWPQRHQAVMWTVTGALLIVAAGSAVAAGSPPQERTPGGSAAGIEEAPKRAVGEIPREPPAFVHRSEVDSIAAAFDSRSRVPVVCLVTGGRGVGKTQIAGEIARRAVLERRGLVGWVSGETADRLLSGLNRIAEELGVADAGGDKRESAQRLRDKLQSGSFPALLVVDNVASADMLREVLPATGRVRILITSTDRSLRVLGRQVDVPVFDRSRSISYLLNRTARTDRAGADLVAGELGDLPLGLSQAAGLLSRQRALTFGEYAQRIKDQPLSGVLKPEPGGYPRGVAEAILQSMQTARDADATGKAVGVLEAISVMDPAGAPIGLLQSMPPGSAGETWSAMELEEVLGLLTDICLLNWTQDGNSVVMHRLVGKVVREVADAQGRLGDITARTMAAMNALLPTAYPAIEP